MKCESGFDCYSMTGFTLEDCPNFLSCGNFRNYASIDELCILSNIWSEICCKDICPECGNKGILDVAEFVCDLDLSKPSSDDDVRVYCYCPTCFWSGSILNSYISFLINNQDLDPRAEGTLVRFYARPTLYNVEASS